MDLVIFTNRENGGLFRVINDQRGYLLCVANSYPHKNMHSLVKAFGPILSIIPHQLVIVGGSGRGESSLRQALETLLEPERVIRLSCVSRDGLIALHQGAFLFVFPRLMRLVDSRFLKPTGLT